MSSKVYSVLAAIGALLVSGVVCHLLAKDSEQLDDAVARVALVPRDVGDWHGHDEETDDPSFALAGARGYWMRSYVNRKTSDSVLVILMCGRPGRMSVHTPEVCYGGAGFELRDQPAAFTIKGEKATPPSQMWTALFTKKTGMMTHMRLYWAWNSRGVWEASPSPRWQFRGEPFLYKLYVSRDNSAQPNLAPQADPAAAFLRQFVPTMNQVLFPADAVKAD